MFQIPCRGARSVSGDKMAARQAQTTQRQWLFVSVPADVSVRRAVVWATGSVRPRPLPGRRGFGLECRPVFGWR